MAKIYNVPEQVMLPSNTFENVNDWQKNDDNFIDNLRDWLLANGYVGKNVGEIIQFPVADGYAQYMILSMKPVSLIHLPLGDAWSYEYVHLLTAKEVNARLEQKKAMEKLFSKHN